MVVDNAVPSIAANAMSIIFGDLRQGYVVRQVQEVRCCAAWNGTLVTRCS